MPTPILSDDELARRKNAIERYLREGHPPPQVTVSGYNGALRMAADELGLDPSSFGHVTQRMMPGGQQFNRYKDKQHLMPDWSLWIDPRIQRRSLNPESVAARKGELGYDPVLPGFMIKETATTYDANGGIRQQRVTQTQEPGEAFAVPIGHRVKGVTARLDANGAIREQYIKTTTGVDPEALIEAATEAFASYRGYARLPPAPAATDADMLTVYPVADLHLGMFAWKPEAGEDYDLSIAVELIRKTFAEVILKSPRSERAVFLGLGDLLHADNTENRTQRSGNILDVDTRYPKVLTASVLLMRQMVEMLLAHHERVEIRLLPGNHDEHSTIALRIGLAAFFDGHARVTVDNDPSDYWFARFGVNLLGAHHGHKSKPAQWPGIMASHCAGDWGSTIWRHFFGGHLHHKQRGGEEHGMTWEIMQTPAPRDAWGAGNGYWAGRSMCSRVYHAEDGFVTGPQVNIRPSLRKARNLAA